MAASFSNPGWAHTVHASHAKPRVAGEVNYSTAKMCRTRIRCMSACTPAGPFGGSVTSPADEPAELVHGDRHRTGSEEPHLPASQCASQAPHHRSAGASRE